MVVALDLTVSLKQFHKEEQDKEEDEGHGIWPENRIKLESTPWRNLPSDLLFNSILVHLSFPCLLRLRCVSHSWRSRLSSSAFWRSWFCHIPNSNPSPGFQPSLESALQSISKSSPPTSAANARQANKQDIQLVANAHGLNPNDFWVLDSISLNANLSSASFANRLVPFLLLCSVSSRASLHGHAARWVKQRSVKFVRSVPAHKSWFYLHENFIQMQEPYTILASEKGLLLLALHNEESEQLLICNPLLRERRVLPTPTSPLVMGISAAHFFVDGKSGEYVVIFDDCQAYYSKLGKWQVIPRSAARPLLDGSIFWLSQQQLSGSNDVLLFAYHPREELVTSVHTQFPADVAFPKRGLVWKDSQGLQTLAAASAWFGVWKFADGVWKKLKRVYWVAIQDVLKLRYVKVGNLLFMNKQGLNQFYVFNLELELGAWMTPCPLSQCLMGHCSFQPSYFQV